MRTIASLRQLVVTGAAMGVVLGGVAYALPAQAGGQSEWRQDVAAVRAATAQYHDEAKAIADGFTPTDECVSSPDGTMGSHYVNFERLGAPLDVTKPAILIYQPSPSGGRTLVAVEYFKVDEDQDLATDDDRPALFGEGFDGPMPGHVEGMPIHYDLHAWVWQHNPSGIFEEWNPAGSCTVHR